MDSQIIAVLLVFFVFDIAIDLRRLFSVSLNSFEPEMANSTIEKLKEEGWNPIRECFW